MLLAQSVKRGLSTLLSCLTPLLLTPLFFPPAYYHEMFLRGRPGLAFRMKRTKYKGKGPRKPASPQSEPNFYHMPSVSGNKEEDKQRNEQEALVSEDPMVTLNQHLDTIQQKLQPNLVAPPQPLLSPSLSLSSVSGPAPNMAPPPSKAPYFDDNVSALLDELIRRSAPAGPGPSRSTSSASSSMTPSCNNATNAGHLNLAAFLANQYRGDNHVHRQQQPPGNYCDTNLNMYQT